LQLGNPEFESRDPEFESRDPEFESRDPEFKMVLCLILPGHRSKLFVALIAANWYFSSVNSRVPVQTFSIWKLLFASVSAIQLFASLSSHVTLHYYSIR